MPIFWLATEDHDFAEVNHTFVFGPDHRPVALSVDGENGTGTSGGRYSELSRRRWIGCARRWRRFPTAKRLPEWWPSPTQPGATFGAAFQALLERLLGEAGVVVYRSSG